MENLPERWCCVTLADVTRILDNQRIPVNANERDARLSNATCRYPYYGATGQVGEIDDFIFEGEAVLLGEDGAPFLDPYKSKAYIASGKYWVNNHAHILRSNGSIDHGLLCHQLNVLDYRLYVSGTTRLKLTQAGLKDLPIRLPPRNEQGRIVEKIETLFSQLDQGEAALREVQKLIVRYRQSVLKAAVTGQLTADWRAENVHRLEHGRDLLQRILQTRRENWHGRGKYKEPVNLDETRLPKLPQGWVWAPLGSLIAQGPQNGLYLPQTKYGTGVPILRIDDYQVDWIRPSAALRLVEANANEAENYALKAGDFVINRVNSVSHLGKAVLISNEYDGVIFESNMMRFSVTENVSRAYLSFYLTSEFGRKLLIRNCKHAVNQASINQGDIAETPVALPSKEEQEEIAQKLALEAAREMEVKRYCQAELIRSSALRQSILKDAFSGRLVPQDPNDEPASELLARIKASGGSTSKPKPPRASKKATA